MSSTQNVNEKPHLTPKITTKVIPEDYIRIY